MSWFKVPYYFASISEGTKDCFSINALYRKYRAQLEGRINAELLDKIFPLRYVFSRTDESDNSFTIVA
jgi:hypothetical protein